MINTKKTIIKEKIVVILRDIPTESLETILKILKAEKIKILEIALNSYDIENQFKILKKYENDFIIGAGTVTTKERLEFALKHNVKFILTPNLNEELLKELESKNILCICGFLTPSEAIVALKYKCCGILKLFPAGDMPINYLKSLKGPIGNFDCMAVGGVTLDNIQTFLSKEFCSVGIGSSVINNKLIKEKKYDEIIENIRKIKKMIINN